MEIVLTGVLMNVMTVSVVFVNKLQKRNKKQKMDFVVLLLLSIHMSLMESVWLLLIGLIMWVLKKN